MNPYSPPAAPLDAGGSSSPISPEEAARINAELKRLNTMSFALGIPGLVLQGWGNSQGGLVGSLATLAGIGLFVAGLVFYAKLRGRHPAFCLLGLLSCVGLLILYFIPKGCLRCGTNAAFTKKTCERCGAPLGA